VLVERINSHVFFAKDKRFVEARRLTQGVRIRMGAPFAGNSDTIYVQVYSG